MDSKLTLSMDAQVIEQAKKYAKKKNTSLSKLIESYLKKAAEGEKESMAISPLVRSLSGVLKLPKNLDHKQAYTDHLSQKYK